MSTPLLPAKLYQGKTVFVTGGGSGINLGIATAFAALGANVAICGRSQDRLDAALPTLLAASAHCGGGALGIAADVRDLAGLAAAFKRARDVLGPIHTVVAGAAGNFLCPAEALSSNGFRSVMEIDLLGAFHTAHASFSYLKATGGTLLFISAPQALLPHAGQAHVGAAKAGIETLMRTLAVEWGPQGIRANSIVPGPIADTEGMRRLSDPAHDAANQRRLPLQRYGRVEEVAHAAVFLASPWAAYITGATLPVDGGTCLVGTGHWNEQVAALLARSNTPTAKGNAQ
jgi:NAD(P)-dependent dehydrogenase (short-subunit alcohol dehydrogenase family)